VVYRTRGTRRGKYFRKKTSEENRERKKKKFKDIKKVLREYQVIKSIITKQK
jgi:hypothetical protein